MAKLIKMHETKTLDVEKVLTEQEILAELDKMIDEGLVEMRGDESQIELLLTERGHCQFKRFRQLMQKLNIRAGVEEEEE